MNLLIGNKFNTIIINETNNLMMQIILSTKFKISNPLLNVKGAKIPTRIIPFLPQKISCFNATRRNKILKNKKKKKNTIRIEISFPEKPRTVCFSFFSSRNVVQPSGIRQERYCATVNRLADARLASCSSTVKGSV